MATNRYKPPKRWSIERIAAAFLILVISLGLSFGVYTFFLPTESRIHIESSILSDSVNHDGQIKPIRGSPNSVGSSSASAAGEKAQINQKPSEVVVSFDESTWEKQRDDMKQFVQSINLQVDSQQNKQCEYTKLDQLSQQQLQPIEDDNRYMVDPPKGGKLNLVCCKTTKGPLTIVVHHVWAPRGAARFMEMVTSGYMNSLIPMMRCVKGFLCQFGLTGDPQRAKDKQFRKTIEDDPNWLPQGPKYRQNEKGVLRFAKGFLAYAGAGKNSRDVQLIVALKGNGPLAGGSPWEVPWGELVGDKSFETLSHIYTGYGEKGPGQGKLMKNGMTDEMKKEFPELDYILSCGNMDEIELPIEPSATAAKET